MSASAGHLQLVGEAAELPQEKSAKTRAPLPATQAPSPEELRKSLFPPLRRDLKVVKHIYGGEEYAVMRDPVSSEFCRLPWRDYQMVAMAEKEDTFDKLAAKWKSAFPELAIEMEEERLLMKASALRRHLMLNQLCELPGQQVLNIHERKEKQKKKVKALKSLTGWMRIYRSLTDPELFLGWLTPKMAFVFTRWFNIGALLLGIYALYLAVLHWQEMGFHSAWLTNPLNLVVLIATIFSLKIIHEIGHGVACKHYGGEIHEAGIMFLFFHPLLYINTTDAWLLPSKYHRMAISAAGIYVELLFAAALMPLWVALQPGFGKDLVMHAILVASFGTVFLNANPLIRYDGYYILSDWLEIPNLRKRTAEITGALMRRFLMGQKGVKPLLGVSASQRRGLAIYATFSFFYMVFLFSHLFGMLDSVMNSVGLRMIAIVLAVAFLTASVGIPLYRLGKDVKKTLRGEKGVSKLRPAAALSATLGALLLISLIPIHREVKRACVVDVANGEVVRAEQPGFVEEVFFKEGDRVQKGDTLARLRNYEIDSDFATLEMTRRQIEARLKMANYYERPEAYRALQSQLEEVEARLTEQRRARAMLEVRATIDGVLATRNIHDLAGRHFNAGDDIFLITPVEAYQVLVPIAEREARFVRRGSKVALRARSFPDRTFRGEVAQEPLATIDNRMPSSLSQKRGGDVYTSIDQEGQEKLIEDQWYALVQLDESSDLLRPGVTGKVKIDCGWETLGQVAMQKILDFFKVDYRL